MNSGAFAAALCNFGNFAVGIVEHIAMGENTFGRLIQQDRMRVAKSIPAIATEVGVDRTYLYRLETQSVDWLNRLLEGGHLKHPSRDLVIRLALALNLSLNGCDELLLLAGDAPLVPLGKLDNTRQRA